jgi:acyl-CoA thioester hydrolase
MNVMWYTAKFDEATWSFFALVGLTPSSLRRDDRGMVALEQHLTYQRELLAGDVVLIRSCALEVKEKALRFRHEMVNAETREVAATSELTGLFIDRSTRRGVALPASVAARAQALLHVDLHEVRR